MGVKPATTSLLCRLGLRALATTFSPRLVLPVQFTHGGDLQDVSGDDGGESSQAGGHVETQVESLSDEPDPEEQEEEGGEAALFFKTQQTKKTTNL